MGIRDVRKRLGLTQDEAARRAGITQSHLSRLESGALSHPTIGTLVKLADALGVSLDEIVGRNVPKRSGRGNAS